MDIMMPMMRTTLTLDPDVVRLIDEAVHRERRPMKHVVNEALRRALAMEAHGDRFSVAPHESAVRAGLDLAGLNRLADELDDEAVLDAVRRSR
jgi:hypothetical protein